MSNVIKILSPAEDAFRNLLDPSGKTELSDPVCRALRNLIIERFRFDPGIDNVREVAMALCEANRFNPITDYLDSLQWDGVPRLDKWMITYLGAEDVALNRAIGRVTLVAMVRRARQPGCKFDFVPIWEGDQGIGKSSAVKILAGGDDNFSDMPILHLRSVREEQEQLKGVWVYELCELSGMGKRDVDALKNFLSRQLDKARGAYAHFPNGQPRSCILIGTTNEVTAYLRDQTGNRRFWPVKVGVVVWPIDLKGLERDRDQLLAEACVAEAAGEPLTIPAELWPAAAAAQEERVMHDPWEDMLRDVKGTIFRRDDLGDEIYEERILANKILSERLGIPADRQTDLLAKRAATVMRRLGWQRKKMKKPAPGGWGYWRKPSPEDVEKAKKQKGSIATVGAEMARTEAGTAAPVGIEPTRE
jgi:predicted P-loop ATPase